MDDYNKASEWVVRNFPKFLQLTGVLNEHPFPQNELSEKSERLASTFGGEAKKYLERWAAADIPFLQRP